MPYQLSEADYCDRFFGAANPPQQPTQSDFIYPLPEPWGRGNLHYIELRSGLGIEIFDVEFRDELQIKIDAHQNNLEFVFKYAGYSQFSNGMIAPPGQDYIFSGEYQPGIGIRGAEKTFEVCIHAELETLRSLLTSYSEPLPADVQQILDGQPTQMIYRPSIITLAKQTVLHQLLNCPYQGLVRKLYLESKVLELIALKLESETSDATSSRRSTLRSQDVERIYQARDLLIRYFDNPPSLLNLAKSGGH